MRTVIYDTTVVFDDGDVQTLRKEVPATQIVDHAFLYPYEKLKLAVMIHLNQWNRAAVMQSNPQQRCRLWHYTYIGFGDDRNPTDDFQG